MTINNYIKNSVEYRMGEWYNKEYSCAEFDWNDKQFIPITKNERWMDWIKRWKEYGINKNPGVIVDSQDHLSELNFKRRLHTLKPFGLDTQNIPYISHNRLSNKNNSILFSLSGTNNLIARLANNNSKKDPYSFDEKINEVIWRGSLSGRDRDGLGFFQSKNIESYANDIQRIKFTTNLSSKFNIKISLSGDQKQILATCKNRSYYYKLRKESEHLFGERLNWFNEICANKYILNLEGHDWPSSLIPSLASNSVTLATTPKWHNIAHFQLEEWVHYVPLKDDTSDFEEKLEWCRNNDQECKNISMRASKYISQFTPSTEKEIEKSIFKNLAKNNKLIQK